MKLQSNGGVSNKLQCQKMSIRCLDKLTVFKHDLNNAIDSELIKLSGSEFLTTNATTRK